MPKEVKTEETKAEEYDISQIEKLHKIAEEPEEDTRQSRDHSTREEEAHEPLQYLPTSLLPEINKDPGYNYRWVRVIARGQQDNANMNARLREGWVPCKSEDHPEFHTFQDKNSRFNGLIEYGGLLLCKISKERSAARQKYYRNMNERQIESVDNNVMRESDRRMPMFKERRTTVSNRGDS